MELQQQQQQHYMADSRSVYTSQGGRMRLRNAKKGKNIKNTVRCKKKNYLLNMLIGTLKLNKVIERSVLNRGS